ncbi:MAG: right-handed parallel beta-helix repeat-containing protein [bacterium]|nr:right-handed parallel beta-helix repeat-containing protein [bacterium]
MTASRGRKTGFRVTIAGWQLLILAALFTGCGKSGTDSSTDTYSIKGIVVLSAAGVITDVQVQLFNAPQDALLSSTLSEYPSIGFTPYALMLFDPLDQAPLQTVNPDSEGRFTFADLNSGNYVITSNVAGYGRSVPISLSLPGSSTPDTLRLYPIEDVIGNLSTTTFSAGRTYRVVVEISDLVLLPNNILTIESGVTVQVDGGYSISIYGGIVVDGSPLEPVRFGPTDDRHALGTSWSGIRIENPTSPCNLTGLVVSNASTAIKVTGGNVEISECFVDSSAVYGIFFSGGAQGSVKHSILRGGSVGLAAGTSGPEFAYNFVPNMALKGMEIKDSSNANISNNVILNCEYGIWTDYHAWPQIHNNLISGGNYGFYAQEWNNSQIQYNTFSSQNTYGILLNSRFCYPIVQFNNFFDMPQFIFRVNGSLNQQINTIQADNNYWDGSEATSIPNRIWDGNDFTNYPISTVMYLPYRETPVTGTGP